jgi:hypothetical protein
MFLDSSKDKAIAAILPNFLLLLVIIAIAG